MKTKNTQYYCTLFNKLRRDYSFGGAPHKPILLISLIQGFQQKLYNSSKITITPEIVGLFKDNWKKLVRTKHQCRFALPFFHMKSEPFWELVPKENLGILTNSKGSIQSFSSLTNGVNYAQIDEELALLLCHKESSQLLLAFILEKYFIETSKNLNSLENNYILEIENQILHEPNAIYQKRLADIKKGIDAGDFQEEVFLRGSIFKREVPKIYGFTCCISKFRVDSIYNISMVDGCHIIPFSESYNDTISNGITLCPNLHRAFDRGLISIDNNYRVIINKNFKESKTPYGLKQFDGLQILLPDNENHHPSLESLNHHHKRFGFI